MELTRREPAAQGPTPTQEQNPHSVTGPPTAASTAPQTGPSPESSVRPGAAAMCPWGSLRAPRWGRPGASFPPATRATGWGT